MSRVLSPLDENAIIGPLKTLVRLFYLEDSVISSSWIILMTFSEQITAANTTEQPSWLWNKAKMHTWFLCERNSQQRSGIADGHQHSARYYCAGS